MRSDAGAAPSFTESLLIPATTVCSDPLDMRAIRANPSVVPTEPPSVQLSFALGYIASCLGASPPWCTMVTVPPAAGTLRITPVSPDCPVLVLSVHRMLVPSDSMSSGRPETDASLVTAPPPAGRLLTSVEATRTTRLPVDSSFPGGQIAADTID